MKSVFEVWRNFRAFWHACPRYFFVWLHQSLFEKRKTKKCSTPCYLFSFFLSFFLPFLPYFILSCVFIFIFIYFFWLRWFSFVFGSFLFCVPFPPDVNQWNTRGSLRLTRLHPPFFGFNGYFSMRGRRFSFVPVNASRVGGLEIIPELFDCSGVARWMENGLNQWNIHRWFDLTNSGAVRGGLKFRDSSSHSAERMD